ncbi:FCD domain-containing protein [Alphaproteobacteria bacterium GH1-50]|uniref:FCD domain-containing protein n=1 Tax=Kangsaoukella pontilimi TaxID=2691042 RepID=A0A7C9IF67_9RHOB|nr:GntR family transcriptional regulator [Kangsaoukella pontilimi]MXQ07308.1 FCD domain-containing protein [Kangsaoukella pontilimi]
MGENDRMTQVEKAIIGLRGLVMSGEFDAGSRLPEVALAERLGVSRTPLRQAMDRLVSEGLLERIESGGCRVASFDLDDINDAIELRGVIEGTAARLAAERGVDAEVIADARGLLARIDEGISGPNSVDFDLYVRLNARFHDMLAQMAGSDLIRREVDRVCRHPLASPNAFLRGQEIIPDFLASLVRAQGQHHAIVDAIEAREGARAEALAREHARLARRNFRFLRDADPRLATRIPGLSLVTAQ